MLKRRLLSLTTIAIAAVSATVLPFRLVHVHRAASGDCVEIELAETGLFIEGEGVNEPVTLQYLGSCFNVISQPSYDGYTVYGYHDHPGTACGQTKAATIPSKWA